MRRIRKGDSVRLKPNIFLLQKSGQVSRVQFVYRYHAYVAPALNGHSSLHVDSLERVFSRKERRKSNG